MQSLDDSGTLLDRATVERLLLLSRVLLASAYGHTGQGEQARSVWADLQQVNPDYSVEERGAILPYRRPEDFERIVEGVRKAGIDATSAAR